MRRKATTAEQRALRRDGPDPVDPLRSRLQTWRSRSSGPGLICGRSHPNVIVD
jgi:hypothetical protein